MASIMADPPDKRGPDADGAKQGQLPAKRAHNGPDFDTIGFHNIDIFVGAADASRPDRAHFNIVVGPVNPSCPIHVDRKRQQMSFCKNSRAYPLALLAARSKEALIHKSWRLRGPANKTVRLPGVRVEVFEAYLHWTGCGNFHMLKCCTQESELGARHAEQTLFIELYQLGCGTLEDVRLRNVATLEMSKTLETCGVLPDKNTFAAVWSIAPHGDCLRRLLVEHVIAKADRDQLGKMIDQLPSMFLQELTQVALRKDSTTQWQPGGLQYLEPEEPEDDTPRRNGPSCH